MGGWLKGNRGAAIAAVLLVFAGVFLALQFNRYRDAGLLPGKVNFVCVATGEKFAVPREQIQVPCRNPKSGELTLLPCYEEEGDLYVSPRYREALIGLGEKNRYVDPETLAVRTTAR